MPPNNNSQNKKDDSSLKNLRTLDSDLKEYKEKLKKYGEEQASAYNDVPPKSSGAPPAQAEEPKVSKPAKAATMAPVADKAGAEILSDEEKEENIPFVELLKIKKKKRLTGEEPPVYNPYIPANISGYPETATPSKPGISSKDVVSEPQIVKESPVIKEEAPDDEKTALRKKIADLGRQHEEWRQKFESLEKDQSRVLDEREELVSKKNEMEKMLQPILKEEKKLEEEIKLIEQQEEAISNESARREKEKERWEKEDQRQKIERQKWAFMEDLDVVVKFIDDKNKTYQSLIETEKEAETKTAELEKEKNAKEAELRLLDIVRLKKDIEVNKARLSSQIKKFEDAIKRLEKSEKSILLEKKEIEDKEHQTKDIEEEKLMENKRWEMEDRLRKVEQEKWQIADKQEKLFEIMADIEGQHAKILLEEKQAASKAGHRPSDG